MADPGPYTPVPVPVRPVFPAFAKWDMSAQCPGHVPCAGATAYRGNAVALQRVSDNQVASDNGEGDGPSKDVRYPARRGRSTIYL